MYVYIFKPHLNITIQYKKQPTSTIHLILHSFLITINSTHPI